MFETRRVLFATTLFTTLLGLTVVQLEAKPAIRKAPAKSSISTQNIQDSIHDVEFSKLRVRYQPEPPEYPELAESQRIQGTVKVEVILGKDGVPKSVNAVSGPIVLRPSGERYSRHWRFDPMTIKVRDAKTKKTFNLPVEARFYLDIPFKLI